MTSATEELRRLMDERGVEWTDKVEDLGLTIAGFADTRWDANGFKWCYIESGGTATLASCRPIEIKGCTPEQAIAATLGSDASAARIADRLRSTADEMRNIGASTMTPHELLAFYAHELDKVADSLMFAATLGSGTCNSEEANPQVCCTDSERNALVRDGEDSHALLPCPFCGGEAKLVSADHPSYTQHRDGWYVICSCGASLGYHGNDDKWETYGDFPHELCAIEAWNTRYEPTWGEFGKMLDRAVRAETRIFEIVRCRDCRFRCFDECTRIDEGFKDYWFAIEPDGFCAWGERTPNGWQ